MKARLTDADVLRAVGQRGGSAPTYLVKNRLNGWGPERFATPQVLRRLKKMESAGLVERVPGSWAVMICWGLTDAGLAALSSQTERSP